MSSEKIIDSSSSVNELSQNGQETSTGSNRPPQYLERTLINQRASTAKLRDKVYPPRRLTMLNQSDHRDWYASQRLNERSTESSGISSREYIQVEPISPPESPRLPANAIISNPMNAINSKRTVFSNARLPHQIDPAVDLAADLSDDDNPSEEQQHVKALRDYLVEVCQQETTGMARNENVTILKQAALENYVEMIRKLKWKKRVCNDSVDQISSSGGHLAPGLSEVTLTPNDSPELTNQDDSSYSTLCSKTKASSVVTNNRNVSPVNESDQHHNNFKCSPLKRRLEEYRHARDYVAEDRIVDIEDRMEGKIDNRFRERSLQFDSRIGERAMHIDNRNGERVMHAENRNGERLLHSDSRTSINRNEGNALNRLDSFSNARYRYMSPNETITSDIKPARETDDELEGSRSKRFITYNDVHFNGNNNSSTGHKLLNGYHDDQASNEDKERWANHESYGTTRSGHYSTMRHTSPPIDSQTALELRRAVQMRSANMLPSLSTMISAPTSEGPETAGFNVDYRSSAVGSGSSSSSHTGAMEEGKYGMDKDSSYWERRRKNNEAAKRSRDSRRAKEEQTARRAAMLAEENLQLRAQIAILKTETANLQLMLYNRM